MDFNLTPCWGSVEVPVMGPGLPQSLSAPQSAQSQSYSQKEPRRDLPRGRESLFWKVFLEAPSGSLSVQVLCLIIASISWKICCLHS